MNDLAKQREEAIEELQATLLEYAEDVVLEALIQNSIVDHTTGTLTDYWLNLLSPDLAKKTQKEFISEQEDVMLSALAKLLQKRMK